MFSEETRAIFDAASGWLCLSAFAPYWFSILRRTTQPAKATWVIWAIVDVLVAAGLHAERELNWLAFGSAGGCCLTAVLAVIRGTPGWTMLDKFCLAGAAIGLLLWWILRSPMIGVGVGLAMTIIGSFPTYVSAWKDPAHEHRLTWFLFSCACVLALLGIRSWTVKGAIQPIVFACIELPITLIVFLRPRKHVPD